MRTRISFITAVAILTTVAAQAQTLPSMTDICRADVSKNLIVDKADTNIVNAAYRTKLGQPKFNPAVDFDHNNVINLADRTFVTTKIGLRCNVVDPPPVNKPLVALTSPQNLLLTKTAAQTVSGTVSDVSLTSGILRVNGVDQNIVLAKGTFSQPVTLVEGQNRFVALATNAAGTGTSAELLVTLDSLGPSLNARMPQGTQPGTDVPVVAEAVDASGVTGVALKVDGAPAGSVAIAPYVFSVPIPDNAAPGTVRELQFSASDSLGNARTIDRVIVVGGTPDSTQPSVLLTAPESATAGEIIPLKASATDNQGLAELTIALGTTQLRKLIAPPFEVQQAFTIPPDAQVGQIFEFGASAADNAGNVGTTGVSVRIVAATSDVPALNLVVNPVASPTFLPTQVVTGSIAPGAVQTTHTPNPFIASLTVTEGNQGDRLNVQINGANSAFQSGVSEATFGPGIMVNAVQVSSPSELVADISISPDASIGPRLVSVQTGPEEALLINAFNVRSGIGNVGGRLLDSNGQPMAKIQVCVSGSTLCAVTDANGVFSLPGAPADATRIQMNVRGLGQVSIPIDLEIGGTAALGNINIDTADVPPPPPPPDGPQPGPALAKALGLGFGETSGGIDLATGRRLITEALIAVGGSEAGVLDETGKQLNPEVLGNGLITLTPDGVRILAHRLERGETVALGDMLFAWSFGFQWTTSAAPTLNEWIEAMQALVNTAWANPQDPQSILPILAFNRGRVMPKAPPVLTPDMRIGSVQAYVLTASFLAAMVDNPQVRLEDAGPLGARPAFLASAGLGSWDWGLPPGLAPPHLVNARRLLAPRSDSAAAYARLLGEVQSGPANSKRFTGFWRNFFTSKQTFPTTVLNNAFQTHLLLQFALALPAIAPGGLVSTLGGLGVAGAYMGTVADTLRTSFQALTLASTVPEAPEILKATTQPPNPDGTVQVNIEFRPSTSHIPPGHSSTSGIAWAYTLYRFRSTDSERKLIGSLVITGKSMVPVVGLGGTTQRLVEGLDKNDFLKNIILTLSDTDPLPMVTDSNGSEVKASTITQFYAITATRFESAADASREDLLERSVPWWNYPLGGRIDPGGLAALHNRTKKQFTSDYSEPRVVTVNASGVETKSEGVEIDRTTGDIFYSVLQDDSSDIRTFFKFAGGDLNTRTAYASAGFKGKNGGLAIDTHGNLFTNNPASEAQFGGRFFKFEAPSGVRTHTGTMNYYSFLLQFAHPTSIGNAMAMGPGSQPDVSAEDLFAIDELQQQVKRVPVSATFDATRRIGQPWATLPFPSRSIDMEFSEPASGETGDAFLLVDLIPAAALTVRVSVEQNFVALGDPFAIDVTVGNPGQVPVSGVRPLISFEGDGEFREVSAPPNPIVLDKGASQSFPIQLRADKYGSVTIKLIGQGTDPSGVTVSSPMTRTVVEILPPLSIELEVPRRAAPGENFDVKVHAKNLSTTTRLINVVPAVIPVDAVLSDGESKGEVAQQSGPTPPSLTLAANQTLTFTYQFQGVKSGRAGFEARATAVNEDTKVPMAVGPVKGGINITPLEIELALAKSSTKLNGEVDATLKVINTGNVNLTAVTPTVAGAGPGGIQIVPSLTPVSIAAGQTHTFQFKVKGVRTGFVLIEATVTAVAQGSNVRSDRLSEPFSVGPTIKGIVLDVGFRSLNVNPGTAPMYASFVELGPIPNLQILAIDQDGIEFEATTGADGRYVMNTDHHGPFTVLVKNPVNKVGVTIRDVRVLVGQDVLTLDIKLPQTLVLQAKNIGNRLKTLYVKIDEKGAAPVENAATATDTYEFKKLADAFLAYVERFEQHEKTPFFEGVLEGTEREQNEWDALERMTVLLAFTKRRFDESVSFASIFVTDVVNYLVGKLSLDKISKSFDQAVNDRLLKVPDGPLLEEEGKKMKKEWEETVKKAGTIKTVLLTINKHVCKVLGDVLLAGIGSGFVSEAKTYEDVSASCKEATGNSEKIINVLHDFLTLQWSKFGPSQLEEALTNFLKTEGNRIGVSLALNTYINDVTEPLLLSSLRKIESPLSVRGSSRIVFDSLRAFDDTIRTENNDLVNKINGTEPPVTGLAAYLKKIQDAAEKKFWEVVKEGGGVLGKLLEFLLKHEKLTAFVEMTVMGPGKVCRASNQIFRADGAFVNEPPATTMFCVEEIPLDVAIPR